MCLGTQPTEGGDAVTVSLAPGGSTEDAIDAYGKALAEAKQIARQALPITY